MHRVNSWGIEKLLAIARTPDEPMLVDAIFLLAHSENGTWIAQYSCNLDLSPAGKISPPPVRSKTSVHSSSGLLEGLIDEKDSRRRLRGKSGAHKFKPPEKLIAKAGKIFLEVPVGSA